MKPGELVNVSNVEMLIPLVGKLVDITVADEKVRARIIGVNSEGTKCKIVSNETKD